MTWVGEPRPSAKRLSPKLPDTEPFVDDRGRLSGRWLVRSTIVFLTAPVALFLLGSLRAAVAWPATLALLYSAWAAQRVLGLPRALPRGRPPSRAASGAAPAGVSPAGAYRGWASLFAGVLVLTAVVGLSGAGGFGIQRWDWSKHNAVLADLIDQAWPPAYRLAAPAGDLALSYYVAYYLPAAIAGKVSGWVAANVVLFAWTALGVVLAWQWIVRLGLTTPPIALAILVLFSGFDVLGAWLAPFDYPGPPQRWWRNFDLEWWRGGLVYPGNLTLIAYAPHQALGGWLAAALSLDALRRGLRRFPHAFTTSLCLLWSPFAALGLALLAAAFVIAGGALRSARRLASICAGQLSPASWAAVAGVGLPVLLYFAARSTTPPLPEYLSASTEARDAARLAFLPATLGPARFAWEWLVFLGLEMLPLVGAIAIGFMLARQKAPAARRFDRRLLVAACLVLATIPCVAYGFYNDWAMRVSIPALFALQWLVARSLSRASVPTWARVATAGMLLVAALYPVAQLRLEWYLIGKRGTWIRVPPREGVPDLFELQRDLVDNETPRYAFLEQYVVGASAPFFRYLARPLAPRTIELADPPAQGRAPGAPAAPTQSN